MNDKHLSYHSHFTSALVLTCLIVAGCTGKHPPEPQGESFAGLTFDLSKAQLKDRGFICNEKQFKDQTRYVACSNFDLKSSVFGLSIIGVEVILGGDEKMRQISVTLPKELSGMNEILELERKLTAVYTFNQEQQGDSENGRLRFWKRPDNAIIKLQVDGGVPGFMVAKTTLTAARQN